MVRGHRSGLLSTADYNNLAQCESLDDIKLNLVSDAACSEHAARIALLSAWATPSGVPAAWPVMHIRPIPLSVNGVKARQMRMLCLPDAVGDGLRAVCAKPGEPTAHDDAGGGVHAAAGGPVGFHARQRETA